MFSRWKALHDSIWVTTVQNYFGSCSVFVRHSRESGNPVCDRLLKSTFFTLRFLDSRVRGNDDEDVTFQG